MKTRQKFTDPSPASEKMDNEFETFEKIKEEFETFLLNNKNVLEEEMLAKRLESCDIALTEEVTILSESDLNRNMKLI